MIECFIERSSADLISGTRDGSRVDVRETAHGRPPADLIRSALRTVGEVDVARRRPDLIRSGIAASGG
jgi:hypothetical protein